MPLILVLSLLAAARDPQLAKAIERYESARFAAAREALVPLVNAPRLTEAERIDARTYLAACYLALKDKSSARLQLEELAKDHPEALPSPATFAPDMIALADEVWAQVAKQRPPEVITKPPVVPITPPEGDPPPPTLVEPAPSTSGAPSRALAFVPFGVGHFARGDYLQGAVWLALEAVLFGISVVTLVKLEDLKVGNSVPLRSGDIYMDQHAEAQRLNATYSITFFAGLAVLAANVIVAFVTWPKDEAP